MAELPGYGETPGLDYPMLPSQFNYFQEDAFNRPPNSMHDTGCAFPTAEGWQNPAGTTSTAPSDSMVPQPSRVNSGAFSDVPESERKKNMRKETQARYHQRRKLKAVGLEQQVADAERAREQLLRERKSHQEKNQALQKLQQYKDEMVDWLHALFGTSEDIGEKSNIDQPPQHPQDDPFVLPSPLFENQYIAKPSDLQLKLFLKTMNYEKLLAHRERAFFHMKNLLQHWKMSCSDTERSKIERIMEVHVDTRLRCCRMILYVNADLFQRLLGTLLIPPGEPTDPVAGVNPLLYSLLTEMEVTPAQRARIRPLWLEYKMDVSAARQQFELARDKANTACGFMPGISSVGGGGGLSGMEGVSSDGSAHHTGDAYHFNNNNDSSGGGVGYSGGGMYDQTMNAVLATTRTADFDRSSLSAQAETYLTVMEASTLMAGYKDREVSLAVKLFAGLFSILTPVQHAIMMVKCYPFFVDPIQLAELIVGGHAPSAAIAQAAKDAPVVDQCHFLLPVRDSTTHHHHQ